MMNFDTAEFKVPPHHRDRELRLGFDTDMSIPDDVEFSPYQVGLREGVWIHVLFDETQDDERGADMAFLKYEPGAFIPGHVHMGFETVLVLQGDYIENGISYKPGQLIVRAPGTCHSMASKNGCLILASRYVPVQQLTSRDFK